MGVLPLFCEDYWTWHTIGKLACYCTMVMWIWLFKTEIIESSMHFFWQSIL
jgi:hypothetical protein